MEINPWYLVVLSVFIILLSGLWLFFRKKRKSQRLVIALFIFLILAAIFFHGVAYRLL
ncbi:TPA: LPXTG cell wall anchor domain-containing protein [Legionella pneumophila]|nr:LPXTG cell wall anchor domain-containing protein [Legionella pneumophila]